MSRLKLYEPPLDYGEDDDDVPDVPPETRTAAEQDYVGFLACLIIGGTVSAALWIVASHFVP